MPSLYAYRKVTDSVTTHTLRPPFDGANSTSQELATLPDGRTVTVLFGDYALPANQPAAIADSIELLASPLPADLRAQIIDNSPALQLIAKRLVDHIREKFSADDESYFNRIGVGQSLGLYKMSDGEKALLLAYAARAEEARQLAKAERTKLGL